MSENPWIEWNGGECPLEPEAAFQVEFRDGTGWRYSAQSPKPMDRCWLHQSHEGRSDIVAYRVVQS